MLVFVNFLKVFFCKNKYKSHHENLYINTIHRTSMLDLKFVIENPKVVKDDLVKRNKADRVWLVDELTQDYEFWRKLKFDIDTLRHERNKVSEEINKRKKEKKDVADLLKRAQEIPNKIKDNEEKSALLDSKTKEKLAQVPNILHVSVPKGKDATENVELKKWGKIQKITHAIKNHVELTEELGIADFETGRLVAGRGFNYLKGALARLDLALQRYGVDFLIARGFTPIIPPILLNKESIGSVVNFTDFADVIYKIENEDLYMIATAEYPLVTMSRNKLFNKEDLPLKVCAVTPCFRKEIGAHGVDTKGLFRMHQFNKVEQVVYTTQDKSYKLLDEIQKITEQFFQSLEIPYRVIEICSGDIGQKQAKQYDIEAWFPRQKEYREVTSASNCTDYQARSLNIRYTEKSEKKYVHILNNTMVATSRAMVAILENFQQKDGSVKIPKVLQQYTGFKDITKN